MTSRIIRVFNDAFRAGGPVAGTWVLTCGVRDLGRDFNHLAIEAVRRFDDFNQDNDPYGEHDFGSLNVAGHSLFWKIDYYDPSLTFGSSDPANPAVTRRVLTVMLASEY